MSEGRFLNSPEEYVEYYCPLLKTVGRKEVEFSRHLLSAFSNQVVFVLICHSIKQTGNEQLEIINIFNRKGNMQHYFIDYSNVTVHLICNVLRECALETLS